MRKEAKKRYYLEFNENIDMKNPQLTLGLIFKDSVQFKRAMIMYSLLKGYEEIHFPKNEMLKIIAKCTIDCP